MDTDFTISMNGLAEGRTVAGFHAGTEFFGGFGSGDILDADVSVSVIIEKSGSYIGIDCLMTGQVTVPCDRCLEDLTVPIEETARLSVKFASGSGEADEGERETLVLDPGDAVLDLSQTVYDYVSLAIPMHRTHPEGACNPDTVRYISAGEPSRSGTVAASSPFAALKDLLG